MCIKRFVALALAMLLVLSLPMGLAESPAPQETDELISYEEEGSPEDDFIPEDMLVEESDTPLVAETLPPAVIAETPDPDASPTQTLSPTPVPTLPLTDDKDMPAPNAEAKAEGIVTLPEGIALFELPSTESSILMQLDSGALLTVKALGLSWSRVDSAGQEGYVPTYALSFGFGSPQPGLAVVTAPGGKLTLRQEMTTKSKALGTIPSGRAVVFLAKGKTFSLVRFDGREGYVLTAHLSEEAADRNLGMLTEVVPAEGRTTANVRLRAEADRQAATYTTIKSGSNVVVKDTKDGWSAVEFEGFHGYMMAKYLKRWE
ncbi:MAG: SH3 domain-containing protein [Eubacteriales bacterium]|nr:SH3 domain-containing protein [Eubacteriales bacterium]